MAFEKTKAKLREEVTEPIRGAITIAFIALGVALATLFAAIAGVFNGS